MKLLGRRKKIDEMRGGKEAYLSEVAQDATAEEAVRRFVKRSQQILITAGSQVESEFGSSEQA